MRVCVRTYSTISHAIPVQRSCKCSCRTLSRAGHEQTFIRGTFEISIQWGLQAFFNLKLLYIISLSGYHFHHINTIKNQKYQITETRFANCIHTRREIKSASCKFMQKFLFFVLFRSLLNNINIHSCPIERNVLRQITATNVRCFGPRMTSKIIRFVELM